ncbi:C2 domain containing protein [Trichomonas vaginalis G3]|uniref:C2 domain containing protein n=1 Tax=Trichomonas vaginalis (strain ATCC PRA-98 / G3) TaxID=412133 RepID=A2GAK4_TRIV3|nr:calcium ion-regulated exocytosis of neurotransmitter [Trichomonas vaginalis G3]EAX85816.1 C2 domain containing protein [Trichomonas vaginalis G3]KAI5485489.1 calcium ion-regulated exocytosis of neurotransmitter [Trichomonas vaginalis G3]|eukprot:XP_001298746.1 C2 domain containing protein [Trichomonas vaginalis G3]
MSKLQVVVMEARGVPKVDVVGWSDPYVQVKVNDGKVVETKVRKNEKNPVWDKRFQFNATSKDTLHLRLMDKDAISKDDPIGEIVIPLGSFKVGEFQCAWFPVKLYPDVKPDKTPCQIRLLIELLP